MVSQHPNFLSMQQVADLLKISRQAVRKQILSGKLEAYKVGELGYIIPKNQFTIKREAQIKK